MRWSEFYRRKGNNPIESGEASVTFDHVTFFYPGAEEPALEDICFTAKPGK